MTLKTSEWAEEQRAWALFWWGGACEVCGETDINKLEFHHINSYTKRWTIGSMWGKLSMESLREELEKCELLCKSCHTKETWKHRDDRAQHGTRSMYVNQKCRCEECREADRVYKRQYKK